MNERTPEFKSAEKKFVIDNEGGFFRATKFVNDPVQYLINLREYLLSESIAEAGLATAAISEIFELEMTIAEEGIVVTDQLLHSFFAAPSQSKEWAVSVFSMLKKAGYTKEEMQTYIALDDPEFSDEERLKEKGLNVHLNNVYGE